VSRVNTGVNDRDPPRSDLQEFRLPYRSAPVVLIIPLIRKKTQRQMDLMMKTSSLLNKLLGMERCNEFRAAGNSSKVTSETSDWARSAAAALSVRFPNTTTFSSGNAIDNGAAKGG
jgi:hypothetical protein